MKPTLFFHPIDRAKRRMDKLLDTMSAIALDLQTKGTRARIKKAKLDNQKHKVHVN